MNGRTVWNWFVENKQLLENILSNVKNIDREDIDNAMNLFEKICISVMKSFGLEWAVKILSNS
jgi:hypothetical protein